MRPLEGCPEALGVSFRASWGLLGLLGSLLAVWEAPLGAEDSTCHIEFPLLGRLRRLSGRLGALLRCLGALGRLGRILGPVGLCGAIWGLCQAVMVAVTYQKSYMRNMCACQGNVAFLGSLLAHSWGFLMASRAVWGAILGVSGRYLMAFGPSRHRARVMGQRLLVCVSGSRGRPLGGLWKAYLEPLGGRFGTSWGLFGASWGPLGGPLGRLGGLLGASGGLLGHSWSPLGLLKAESWIF